MKECEGLCQWCLHWLPERGARMGTCMVVRRIKTAVIKSRGTAQVMQTKKAHIITHADDGCSDHYVERPGLFHRVDVNAAPSLGG